MFRGNNVLFFWGRLAFVDAEIFFFLSFPDANTGVGFISEDFGTALGSNGRVQRLLGVVEDIYLPLYIWCRQVLP